MVSFLTAAFTYRWRRAFYMNENVNLFHFCKMNLRTGGPYSVFIVYLLRRLVVYRFIVIVNEVRKVSASKYY